jgi:hypothetical protein
MNDTQIQAFAHVPIHSMGKALNDREPHSRTFRLAQKPTCVSTYIPIRSIGGSPICSNAASPDRLITAAPMRAITYSPIAAFAHMLIRRFSQSRIIRLSEGALHRFADLPICRFADLPKRSAACSPIATNKKPVYLSDAFLPPIPASEWRRHSPSRRHSKGVRTPPARRALPSPCGRNGYGIPIAYPAISHRTAKHRARDANAVARPQTKQQRSEVSHRRFASQE